MRTLKPKLIVPAATSVGGQAQRWIAACLDYLRTECHLAVNTIAAYRRDLRRFCEWLGGRFAAKLTVRDLSDYMGWLQTKKLAPASIARHIVALKMFFRYLQLEGIVRDNLAELLGTQKTLAARAGGAVAGRSSSGCSPRRSRTMPSGGATGRCWNCSTPPAAGRRRCRT